MKKHNFRNMFEKVENRIEYYKQMVGIYRLGSKQEKKEYKNLKYNRDRLETLKKLYPEEYTIYKLEKFND